MRATTAIFDVIFVGAGMTSKTVVTKIDVRKSGPVINRPHPQDCFGGRETAAGSVTLVTE
jgi:hypothetical protein